MTGGTGCGVGAVNLSELRGIELMTLEAELRLFTYKEVRAGRCMA
jgi:hypothetical protein